MNVNETPSFAANARHALSTHETTTSAEFWAMEEAWKGLFARCACPSAFASWEWAAHWWRHFGVREARGRHPHPIVVAAHDGRGQVIGLAAFYEAAARLGPLGERRLEPFGVTRPADLLSEEPSFLGRAGDEGAAFDAITRHLRDRAPAPRWNHFTVNALRPAPSVREQPPAPWEGALVQRAWDSGPYTVALPPTWDALRRGLSRSMRDNLAYYPRRLAKAGHRWRVRLVRQPDEVRVRVPELIALHHDRAASGRGPRHVDHMPQAVHREFLRDVLPAMAASGMAFLGVLEVDGTPVASQAFLEAGGVVTFTHSGFDPAWHDFSPLTVLAAEVIRDAVERRVSALNFLAWDAPWKARWGARQTLVREHRVGFSRHPASSLYAAARLAALRRRP